MIDLCSDPMAATVVASLLQGIAQSDIVGKIIVIILFASSVVVWYIMVEKIIELRNARRQTHRFLHSFRREPHPVRPFLSNRGIAGSPLIKMYNNTCRSLGLQITPKAREVAQLFPNDTDFALNREQLDAVRNTAERNVVDEALELESGMVLLATATSAAPFLGLLGTVWGVMSALTAMASAGSADLTATLPGISSALSTTVVGLIVALPSLIGYNFIARTIRSMSVQMDNFSQELIEEIQRHS